MLYRLTTIAGFLLLSAANGAVWYGVAWKMGSPWAPGLALFTTAMTFWTFCILRASSDT